MKTQFPGKQTILVGLGVVALLGCATVVPSTAPQVDTPALASASTSTDLSERVQDLQRTQAFIQAVMDRDLANPARKGLWSQILNELWVDYTVAVEQASLALKLAAIPAGNDQDRWIDEARKAVADATNKQGLIQQAALKNVFKVTDAYTLRPFNGLK